MTFGRIRLIDEILRDVRHIPAWMTSAPAARADSKAAVGPISPSVGAVIRTTSVGRHTELRLNRPRMSRQSRSENTRNSGLPVVPDVAKNLVHSSGGVHA